MIYLRLLNREQAESIVRESSGPVRYAVGKSDAEMLETIGAVMNSQPYQTAALLRTVCAILDLSNIPYTCARVPA